MHWRHYGLRSFLGSVFLLSATAAHAEFGMSLGVEYFNLSEELEGRGQIVDETGPMFVLGVNWRQPRREGLLWGYAGQFYTGNVDYDGQTQLGEPYQSTSQYLGTSHEGQLAWGWRLRERHILEAGGSLGVEWFRRTIANGGGGDQMEDFQILYTRLGVAYSAESAHRFSVDGGIKYPLRIREDAHLQDLGLDANPSLEPKGQPSLYAGLEYRFSREFRLRLYYDSYRFDTSDPVTASATRSIGDCGTGEVCRVIQPQTQIHRLGLAFKTVF